MTRRPFLLQMLGVALAAMLPMAALLLVDVVRKTGELQAAADAALHTRAQAVAADAARTLSRGHRMLEFMAQRPEIRRLDTARCAELLRGLDGIEPVFANTGLADVQGRALCVSRDGGQPLPTDVTRFGWFERALAARGPVLGPPRIGAVVKRPTLAVAQQLGAPGAPARAVVMVSLDLAVMSAGWGPGPALPGGVVELVDADGRTVARVPGAADDIGRPGLLIPEAAAPTGVTAPGADGRVWRYARVSLPGSGWRATVAAPEDLLLAPVHAELRHGLLTMLAALMASALTAWVLGRRLARPLDQLWQALATLTKGSARRGAFGQLADEFRRAIAERQQAEQRVLASERRLREMYDSVDVFVVSLDLDWRITYCNEAFARRVGRVRDHLPGLDWKTEFVPEARRARLADATLALRSGSLPRLTESEVLCGDGCTRRVRWSNAPLHDDAGQLVGLVGVGQDITEERAAKRALRRMQGLYEALSRVNRAIVRTHDEAALCAEVCAACVEAGHAGFASVRRLVQGQLVTTAQAGSTALYPPDWAKTWALDDPRMAGSLTQQAVQTARLSFSNDYLQDGCGQAWLAMAQRAKVQAMAVVPLMHGGHCDGVLTLHVQERGWFDEPLLALLREMGDDLAYALRSLRHERERAQAQREVLEGERRFRHLFDAAPQVKTLSAWPTGELLDVNRAFVEAAGLPRELALGRTLAALGIGLPADDTARLVRELAESGGHVRGMQAGFTGADGHRRDVMVQAEFIDFGGQPALLTRYSDVSQLKRAERTLRDREQQLAGIVETTMDAIVSVDATHRIRFFNQAASAMLGVEASAAIGTPLSRFVPALQRGAYTQQLHQFAASGSTSRRMGALHELNALRADGSAFPIEASISRSGEGEALLLTVVVRDLSGAREAEAARRAQAVAEAANAAKSRFLSHISHELRPPLGAILGLSRLMQDDAAEALGPGQRERARLGEAAGQHLLGLIEDLLDFARLEMGHLQVARLPVDLGAAVEAAAAFCAAELQRHGVSLTLDFEPGPRPAVLGDPKRLRQVLVNLVSNGAKYNRPGGRVRVLVRTQGEQVAVTVADDGLGMDAAQRARLFQPYDRLGREGSGIDGTGIGLALTRELVRGMGGAIAITSEAGVGTQACVSLLRTAGVAPPPRDTAAAGLEPAGRVLYVEDEPVNRFVVEQLLARWPRIELLLAEDGRQALALAERKPPDLVLLDMNLPDMHGLEILAALRRRPGLAGCPILIASASNSDEDRARAAAGGADAYWTKPLNFELVAAELTRRLGRPRVVPEAAVAD
jgi:PAS domain S-box-containing protein